MGKIFQPGSKIQLTNVSLVRLKKGGKRFEIACYKNKVSEWRNGAEKDIDEVLQIHQIFTNVSKGQVAKSEDLEKIFKTTDIDAIIAEILKKGEQQISEKERSTHLESMYRDISTIVAEKCINPQTKKPYPVSIIEKAMKELQFSVNPNQSAKKQALDVIKQLQSSQKLPIERAQMRLRVVIPPLKDAKQTREKINSMIVSVEEENWSQSSGCEVICLIDPGQYRNIIDLLKATCRNQEEVTVLSLSSLQDDSSFV
ncbi:hypothetical protein BB560_004270 [Smittium megazygosporum]|uniref:Ribosome maturation protein SDO1 n=1 Tax=Smittium megazygosporum TaxID=133381 RepID=A0A2T9Z9Q1_9FUNG|nr:hypothetical protein BB560_004270 [Smittium megazygosporum]